VYSRLVPLFMPTSPASPMAFPAVYAYALRKTCCLLGFTVGPETQQRIVRKVFQMGYRTNGC
jgi:hypothetical protein